MPGAEFLQQVSCDYCGSAEYSVLHHYPAGFYRHSHYITYSWDGNQDVSLTIVKCKGCGLVYQNPRFKAEKLGLLYTDSVTETVDREEAVRTHKFGPLVEMVKKHCANTVHDPVSLDIGTRYGLLPEVLRRNGYNAHGIELNKLCVDQAARSGFINVHHGNIDDTEKVLRSKGITRINLVTMTDVIEHLLTPYRDLQTLSAMQQKGDYMVIQTVDVSSPGYRIFRKWWYHIHGQHTYYFSGKTLGMMYDKLGYDITAELKVPLLNNLKILPTVTSKFLSHIRLRKESFTSPPPAQKIWFAGTRPTLFDIITIVAKKR